MMGVRIVLTGALALAVATTVQAQPAPPAAGSEAIDAAALAKLRERVRADRRALVEQNLPLTDEEAKKFWPVYDRCQLSIQGSQRKANRVILEVVQADGRLTDAHAKQLLGEILTAEADEVHRRRVCFEQVAKVLPGVKTARFFQIETKLDALARFDVATTIPLVQ